MPKRDINQLAKFIADQATNKVPKAKPKNAKRQALGFKGGLARAKKLTRQQRKQISKAAAAKRWKRDIGQ